jgi:carboxypeptidase family protein
MIRLIKMMAVLMIGAALMAQTGNKKDPPKTADLNFLVVRDSNGNPVRNAEIVLHPVDEKGKQKMEGLELKTHADGKAQITGIPYGKMRIQVIAPGFRTYGEDFDIHQPAQEFTIKLQKPTDQITIYK